MIVCIVIVAGKVFRWCVQTLCVALRIAPNSLNYAITIVSKTFPATIGCPFVTQHNKRDILSARFILRKWAKQCVKYEENKMKFTLCKTCIFKSITSIFMNLVSLESLLNFLLDNAKISKFSKVDKMYLPLYCNLWKDHISFNMNMMCQHYLDLKHSN